MSTKMKSTMPADSSSASAKLTGPSAYSSNRPRYRSGGSQASKFIGKTKEMNGKIFDIGAGQGTKYLATQEELAEYVARTNPKGHRASTAIATLTPIAYSYPEEPTGKAADGIADLPEIKQKLQIFRYESEQKKVDKMKIEDDGIMQNAYWIAYGQCSEPLRNELDTESAFPKISQDGDVIGLLKMIKQLCYNFQSHKYGPQAIHDAMRKFEMLQQDQHQSTSDYLKKFTASVDVIDSVGATVGVHKSLVDEEMHQLQAEYTAADEAGKRGIYEDCQAKAREKYLATAYLMGADRKRYGTMLTEMENNYSRGYDQWPKDMVKAHMLLVNWKADTRRATGGLQQTALSYVATGQGQGEQGGRGGGGGRGSPEGPGRGAGGRGGGNPNWICHLCGDQGHRHLDCPQREAVAEFLKSQTHAQIEDDTADATTEVSTITDATGLGDVAKNMFDKISRSDPRKAVNMLQNMISEESDDAPSQTTGDEKDHVNSLLGFIQCTEGTQLQNAGEAFNLANVDIPKDWVLLDSQSTLHLFCNPHHPMLHNTRSGPGTMSIFCNAGTARTTTIADVVGLAGDPAWIHPSGLANVLSLAKVTKEYRVTFDSHDGNEFIVHVRDNHSIRFKQSRRGLYYYDPTEHCSSATTLVTATQPEIPSIATGLQELALVTTVDGQKELFTKRSIKAATTARELQQIMMSPGERTMKRIVGDGLIQDSPVTTEHLNHAAVIYGPNVLGLKGKSTKPKVPSVSVDIVKVPPAIMSLYRNVTACADNFFVNKVAFFGTISLNLRYRFIARLFDRHVPTLLKACRILQRLYFMRGFLLRVLKMDPEFEPLRVGLEDMQILLNTTGQGDHVPEAERLVRTTKDSARAGFAGTPFKKLPVVLTVGLILATAFWGNAIAAADGVSKTLSPDAIVTGRRLQYKKHCRVPFGQYVQTFEDGDNTIEKERTLGAIAICPTGNTQGTHMFMNLNTGRLITRTSWLPLPMPKHVVDRVHQLADAQPRGLEFRNRNNQLIPDDEDDEYDDADDDSYTPGDDNDSNSDDDGPYTDDNDSDDDGDNDDDNDEYPGAPIVQDTADAPIYDDIAAGVTTHNNDANIPPAIDNSPDNDDGDPDIALAPLPDMAQMAGVPPENAGVVGNAGVAENTGVDQTGDDDTLSQQAEQAPAGNNAQQEQVAEPTERRRTRGNKISFDHIYNADSTVVPAFNKSNFTTDGSIEYTFDYMSEGAMEEILLGQTDQMSMRRGLKMFGGAGVDAVHKEMKQLHDRGVPIPVDASKMSSGSKAAALKYLMFLKMKRDGSVKGRGCADGRTQRAYITKDESSSPTVATESLMISCVIDATERRKVATVDIPGAFLQADMDELVHVKFEGVMADLLTKIDPALYSKYAVKERGQTVIYAALAHPLYGILRASLLFWRKLTGVLVDNGYQINPYDWCVANKMVEGTQCTVLWHVDDLKLSHVSDSVLDAEIAIIDEVFGSKDAPLTIRRGTKHDYLGMTLDYSQDGKVIITMLDYIDGFLSEIPESLKGDSATAAPNHLFEVGESAPKLQPTDAKVYYHHTMQLLWLSKRARPDLQLPLSYLTTRVQEPNLHDWKKLARTCKYLHSTRDLPLTLEADSLQSIKWYVDVSFAVHNDMRSHTGMMMTLGKGCVYGSAGKQKINTKSSTEGELVGVSDALPQVVWSRNFIEAQGYDVKESIIYQDNQSTIRLCVNGRGSSGKRTRHINVRYFFITDRVNSKEVSIEYCPTDEMIADFFSKPLQGSKFIKFRDLILNITK